MITHCVRGFAQGRSHTKHGDGDVFGRRVVRGDPFDEIRDDGGGVERGSHNSKLSGGGPSGLDDTHA